MDIQDIISKVESGKALTREEELLYMTKVCHYTQEEALNVFAVVDNKDSNLIID